MFERSRQLRAQRCRRSRALIRLTSLRLTSRRPNADEGGFILLESVVAIGLITVLMTAMTAFLTTTTQTTNHLRIRQEAIQLADTGIDNVRSYKPATLKTGRDDQSSKTAYDSGVTAAAPAVLRTALQGIDRNALAIDAGALGNSALAPTGCAALPQTSATVYFFTSPTCQTVGTKSFWRTTYLGNCYTPASGGDCVTSGSVKNSAGAVTYLRAVIAVTWTDPASPAPCSDSSCIYVTSTLISNSTDPIVPTLVSAPVVPLVGAITLTKYVGDVVSVPPPPLPGAVGPYSNWTSKGLGSPILTPTGLPPGLITNADGSISGTITPIPSPVLSYPAQLSSYDAFIRNVTENVTFTVFQLPTISALPDQTTQVSVAVHPPSPTYACPNSPCTFKLTPTTAQDATQFLSIDSRTGAITGTPSVAQATKPETITITDAGGRTASMTFNWTVLTPATVCVTPIALTNGSFEDSNIARGAPNFLNGGVSPLIWDTTEPDNKIELWKNDGTPGPYAQVTAQTANGGVPISAEEGSQWAELNANQVGALYQDIATVPGQILQWSVWHRGRYSNASNASKKDIMQVQIGTAAAQTPQFPTGQNTANIADGPYAWTLYRGIYTVPDKQTITRFQFAAISTASGDDSIGNFIDNLSLNNYVACLANLPGAQTSTVNAAISPLQLSALRGSGNFVWGGGATLPAGLSISASGLISGTPTQTGTSNVVLTLTDTDTAFAQSVSFPWTVLDAPSVTPPASQRSAVGAVISLAVTATCPNTPCTFAINLAPSGLSISNAGLITGTISGSAQTYSGATVTVRDNQGVTATSTPFSWIVSAGLAISNPGNQYIVQRGADTLDMATLTTGGTRPYTFAAAGLPAWLTINPSTGMISGTAPAANSVTSGITVTVTDAARTASTTSAFSWTVYSQSTVTAPANQASSVGTPVNLALTVSCNYAPCSYAFNSSAPTGLFITNTGSITGSISAAAANYTGIAITQTDAGGVATVSSPFSWLVNPAPSITSPGNQRTLHAAAVSLDMASLAGGGTGGYKFTASGLPSWLGINANNGKITGTAPGGADTITTPITITLTDATGASATTSPFSWTVSNALATAFLSQTTFKSTAVSVNLNNFTTGGTGPYTYAASSGLPTWLSLNPTTGVISGTAPTVAANSTTKSANFTITVTDSAATPARVNSSTVNWLVTDLQWAAPATMSSAVGSSVSVNVAPYLSGGSGNTTFSAVQLPTGLSMSPAGLISGTASTASATPKSVIISATDSIGATVTSTIAWTVS